MAKNTMRWLLLAVMIGIFSVAFCAMNRCEFDAVLLGSSITDVVAQVGEPYSVHTLDYGAEEYEYIERFVMNNALVYENHYYLKVVNGQVVSKRFSQENRPAYDLLYQRDPNYQNFP